jgi:hypothetical protein
MGENMTVSKYNYIVLVSKISRDGILRRLAIFLSVSDFVQFDISLRIMKNNDD